MIESLSPALLVVFILAFFAWYIAFVMFSTRAKFQKTEES